MIMIFNFLGKTVYAADDANALLLSINKQILNPIIGLMLGLALVIFLYGVVEFIAGAGSEDKRSAGKKHIVWGIVGLFIMFSVFGIINLIIETIGA